MDTRQLRSFIAVAQHLNFTEAAKHLHLAQSSLSRQIAELEKELGVTLFYRTNRAVQLTSAGTLMLKEATALISRIDELTEQTRKANSGLIGSLKIGCQGVEKYFFPQLAKHFRQAYANINVTIDWLSIKALTLALIHEHIDVGFTLELEVQNNPDLISKVIYTDPLVVMMPYDHPLAKNSSISLASLAKEPFLILSRQECPSGFQNTVRLCIDNGFSPDIVSEPSSLEALMLLVESGLGISLISQHIEAYGNSNLRFIPLTEKEATINIVVCWHRKNTNPIIPIFINELDQLLLSYNKPATSQ
ncbi:MAG: transcriptional regulator AlsR family [Firmicutes bacterium]|nr:transcriptional regulator AlsR family [Bacillota bacterium]